jgi:hypothetical protein
MICCWRCQIYIFLIFIHFLTHTVVLKHINNHVWYMSILHVCIVIPYVIYTYMYLYFYLSMAKLVTLSLFKKMYWYHLNHVTISKPSSQTVYYYNKLSFTNLKYRTCDNDPGVNISEDNWPWGQYTIWQRVGKHRLPYKSSIQNVWQTWYHIGKQTTLQIFNTEHVTNVTPCR